MTICEDAFLSLTDSQGSPAEFLFFPKIEIDGKSMRAPEIWNRGDYKLLTPAELNEQVQRYLLAREDARQVLLSQFEKDRKRRTEEARKVADESGEADTDDLFKLLDKK